MSYYIYRLKFDTSVHFGAAEQGGKLEQTEFGFSSDSLFSAICCELAMQQEYELLARFIDKIENGKIVFSDLLPYHKTGIESDPISYYLPKPVFLLQRKRLQKQSSLAEVKRDTTERKKQKKMDYLRVSHIASYIEAMQEGKSFHVTGEFGQKYLIEKVACRNEEALPYRMMGFSFSEQAGLYIIVRLAEEADVSRFGHLLDCLGLTGIGGKRSSGYGKFHLDGEVVCVEEGSNSDVTTLYHMLENTTANWYMSLSSLLPQQEDLPIVKQSYYKLKRRSGFVTPINDSMEQKKNSIYMLGSGSCFPSRLMGRIALLEHEKHHDILRSGQALYVGLPS